MKIQNLTEFLPDNSTNCFFIAGDFGGEEDINALIDTDSSDQIIDLLTEMDLGIRTRKIDRIILTNPSATNIQVLKNLKQVFNPEVLSLFPNCLLADRQLDDGDHLKLGDRMFEVLRITRDEREWSGLYSQKEGILFAGLIMDLIIGPTTLLDSFYFALLERLNHMTLKTIYFSRGSPMQFGTGQVEISSIIQNKSEI